MKLLLNVNGHQSFECYTAIAYKKVSSKKCDVCSYSGCASSSHFVSEAYCMLRYACTCSPRLFNGLVHCCSLAQFATNMVSVLEGGGDVLRIEGTAQAI
jgi:hypothetical protein